MAAAGSARAEMGGLALSNESDLSKRSSLTSVFVPMYQFPILTSRSSFSRTRVLRYIIFDGAHLMVVALKDDSHHRESIP